MVYPRWMRTEAYECQCFLSRPSETCQRCSWTPPNHRPCAETSSCPKPSSSVSTKYPNVCGTCPSPYTCHVSISNRLRCGDVPSFPFLPKTHNHEFQPLQPLLCQNHITSVKLGSQGSRQFLQTVFPRIHTNGHHARQQGSDCNTTVRTKVQSQLVTKTELVVNRPWHVGTMFQSSEVLLGGSVESPNHCDLCARQKLAIEADILFV